MKKQKYSQIFILLTNKSSETVIKEYQKIKKSSEGLGDSYIMYHRKAEDDIPQEIKCVEHYVFGDDILKDLNYIPIYDKLLPGSNHFPLLEFYLNNPRYDYYWYIEDDVKYNGNWKEIFCFFSESAYQPDFLSCHIRTYSESPDWYWWDTINHPHRYIPLFCRLRSFNPIFRISNSALNYINHALLDRWVGHHEVLLPSLLYLEGFRITDFGGTGPFVIPSLKNKFYVDDVFDTTGKLKTGTMRYRPLILEEEYKENKLYHPVKNF